MNLHLANKRVAVVGLGSHGRSARALLARSGARVFEMDEREDSAIQAATTEQLDLAAIDPEVPRESKLVKALRDRKVSVVSELELGYQFSSCLNIAVTGTNGKGTVSELIERVLVANDRKVIRCGDSACPITSVVDKSRDADFLVVNASAAQLERIEFFRPVVAVLTNLAADEPARFPSASDYARICGSVFRNQQAQDWAIVQSEAVAELKRLGVALPGKTITFSSSDPEADLYFDRGLIISRLANWPGPLIDLEHCSIRGSHNAENIMAALAVGHVLRLPLGAMVDAIKSYTAGPHRCERVAEVKGVTFVNDSKAANLDAVQKALFAVTTKPGAGANVWLIAGGRDKGLEYHDLGPALSKRAKGVFAFDQAAEKMRAAWSLFTPCTITYSLLEAVQEAARNATSGDVVLLSPACSSFDQFQDQEQCGERFYSAVKSISSGGETNDPNIDGKNGTK